eukprot:gene1876-4971_t
MSKPHRHRRKRETTRNAVAFVASAAAVSVSVVVEMEHEVIAGFVELCANGRNTLSSGTQNSSCKYSSGTQTAAALRQ